MFKVFLVLYLFESNHISFHLPIRKHKQQKLSEFHINHKNDKKTTLETHIKTSSISLFPMPVH